MRFIHCADNSQNKQQQRNDATCGWTNHQGTNSNRQQNDHVNSNSNPKHNQSDIRHRLIYATEPNYFIALNSHNSLTLSLSLSGLATLYCCFILFILYYFLFKIIELFAVNAIDVGYRIFCVSPFRMRVQFG